LPIVAGTFVGAISRQRRGNAHGPDDSHRAPYQSLGHLCEQLGVVYKSLFKLDKKDMSRSDFGETLLYGADTKYTLWLYHRQTSLLRTVTVGQAQASTPTGGASSRRPIAGGITSSARRNEQPQHAITSAPCRARASIIYDSGSVGRASRVARDHGC
jgi:hypothetical protein